MKVDIIKMHITGGPMDMTPAVYGALIDQAHKRGLRTAAHLFYLRDAKGLLEKGIDVIAHSIRDLPVDQPTIAAIKARDVEYIPTLTRDIATFVYEGTPPYLNDPFFTRHIPNSYYSAEMAKMKDPANQEKIKKDKTAQDIKPALNRAGRTSRRSPMQGSRSRSAPTPAPTKVSGRGISSTSSSRRW